MLLIDILNGLNFAGADFSSHERGSKKEAIAESHAQEDP